MKKKLYVGFSMTVHDPSIAIVNHKGELVFAEATERYLQNKRAYNGIPDDINLIDKLTMKFDDNCDEYVIAYTWEKKYLKIITLFKNIISNYYLNKDKTSFVPNALKTEVANFLLVGENLRYRVSKLNPKAVITKKYYKHHDTHAATACYGSAFENAVCAIIDGYGEYNSTHFFSYKDLKIRSLSENKISYASLGEIYTDVCAICGFDPIKGEEWKVMGLAPYGKFNQNIYDLLNDLIEVDHLSIRFKSGFENTRKKLFEMRRKPNQPALEFADIAYTSQEYFSDIITMLLNELYKIGNTDKLILSGGCALNSSYNGKILEKTPFKSLYVPSAPADDGNSIGAAYLAYYDDHPMKKTITSIQTPYLGHQARTETLQNVINLGGLKNHLKTEENIYQKTAQLLAEGKIVGWFQGRSEMGPRALGNRSILADPRSFDVKEKINMTVKFREEFRPFAPSILHEFGNEYFENYQESPYMERTLRFRKEVQDKVPGVVHVDGTGRLQTVKKEWNEKYYQLIYEFYKITKIPILLNTSFNVMGKPIVHTVEDAIAVFYSSGLNVLVIEDKVFIKE